MFGWIAFAPGIPFHATGTLTSHHIGVCTTDTSVFDWFVYIKSGMIFCSSLYHFTVMTYIVLPMMIVPIGKSAGITGLHTMNTQVSIPFIRLIQLFFIIDYVATRFMVSNNLNSFFLSITDYFLYIKISIRTRIIKVLRASPIFPTGVPAFKHHSFNVVSCCKVNIPFSILRCGTVAVIYHPTFYTQMHSPPDTYIFHWTYPIRSFQYTRLIQIQYKPGVN